MYAWIWRKLPFGLYGKIGGSLLLGLTCVLLWFVVFPWADPFLPPYDDVQVGDPGAEFGDTWEPGQPTPSGNPNDPNDPNYIPYETTEPEPTPSQRR